MTTQWNGSSGTPIQLRTHAPMQTEEQRNRQPTRKHHIVEDDNDDAYTIEKPHTSAIRYDRPQHRRTSMLPEYQKTTRMRRGIDRWTLIIIVTLFLIVMLGG